MGYRKVSWIEQCWYVLKWKLHTVHKKLNRRKTK